MSKRWPSSRLFVDKSGSILDPWNGPLQQLEPLLALSVQDFATLQALIRAAQETAADVESGGTGDPLELAINNEPLLSEDYFIGWKTSEQAGRRFPMSLFGSSLISTTSLSGAGVGITIPSTFKHARLVIFGMSFSTTAQATFSLSEDGGSTFLNAAYEVFNHASLVAATTGASAPALTPSGGSGATAVFSAQIDIHNVVGSSNKMAVMDLVLDSSGSACTGSYIFTSTGAVNYVQFAATAGTFDAGSIELWGMP